ncbi:MAG: hypothetical protein ABR975_03805 [Vulcanimicrobiaceae bacterium]|jgi:hypothetical protein
MSQDSALTSTLLTLFVVLFVVVRFAFRELKDRIVRAKGLWRRPLLFVLLGVVLGYQAMQIGGVDSGAFAVETIVSVLVGIVVGLLVVRFTTFAPAPASEYPAVRAQGSWKTLVVWIIALALRFGPRFFMHSEGSGQQLALNAALLALVAAAFAVVAVYFGRAIRAYPPAR